MEITGGKCKMEQLLPVMNRLQDVMVSVGFTNAITGLADIDLPQIAVIGSQSVGKSSVLESLVGRDFLPRGSGIVTRRPLILQLRNIESCKNEEGHFSIDRNPNSHNQHDCAYYNNYLNDTDKELENYSTLITNTIPSEWGEFGHAPGIKFDNFSLIREEIILETERVIGKNKGISPHPILLKIFSPNVIDLTLIDLPGITKVPIGEQPHDIEVQIRRMILSFITKPNCIILAVTAANTDLANSDALQMAREVDPIGSRTVGVITKCDLMDAETDAMDMLLGKIYPLQKGYVGVVCRSQKDINKHKTMQEAIKEEDHFFNSHAAYRSIHHRCGTQFLGVLLNQILMLHIQDTLPDLKRKIYVLAQEYESELTTYGDSLLETYGNQGALLLHFFSKFSRNFQDAIEGRLTALHSSHQLTGGARINYIFHDWFGTALMKFDPLDGLSDIEIRTAIRNATGPKASLFVPEGAFEILVRKQIAKLEQPSLQCVEQVYEELQRILEKCDLTEGARFRWLRERMLQVVKSILKKCLGPTNQMISNLIQMELAYLNTNHPDFLGGNGAMTSQTTNISAPPAFHQLLTGQTTNNHYTTTVQGTGIYQQQMTGGNQLIPNNTASLLPLRQIENSVIQPNPSLLTTVSHSQAVGSLYPPQHDTATQVLQHTTSQQRAHSKTTYSNGQTKPSINHTPPDHGQQTLSQSVVPTILDSHSTTSLPQHQPTSTGGLLNFLIGLRGGNSVNTSHSTTSPGKLQSQFPIVTSSTPRLREESHSLLSTDSNILAGGHHLPILTGNRIHSFPHTPRMANQIRSCTTASSAGYNPFETSTIGIQLPQVPLIVTPPDAPNERERTEIELIKLLIQSYFNIVRKNIADYVPKSIMSFMVNTAKDVIQRELVSQLYKEELFNDLLRESDEIADARSRCKNTLETLKTALDIISQIRDSDWDES